MAQALPACHGEFWVKIVRCHFDSFYMGFRHLLTSFPAPRYSPRLWDARAEVFSDGTTAAGESLQQLLLEATTPFWEAGDGHLWILQDFSKEVSRILQCEIILNVKGRHFLSTAIVGLSWLFYILLNLSIFPKAFPKKAFACPAAVVSSFFSLARVMAMQQRLRRALALIHLGTMDWTPSQELET